VCLLDNQENSFWYALNGTNLNTPVGAILAACVLFLLPAPSAFAAVSCEPLQRGTLDADGAFTRGIGASDTDYRVSCTGDGMADDVVRWQHLEDAVDAPGADDIPDGAVRDPDARLILEIDNAYARLSTRTFPPDDVELGFPIVIRGRVRGASAPRDGVELYVDETLASDLSVDSHADIHSTGAARGIEIRYREGLSGSIRLRNFGRIVTEGGGTEDQPRRGDAVNLQSPGGDVEFINEAGATITTFGVAARGIFALAQTEAVVENYGAITTSGGANADSDQRSPGIVATVRSGVARAVNEVGGTIRTEGRGARGLSASICDWTGEECDPAGHGTATAVNRGSVVTTGDAYVRDGGGTWSSGVFARAEGRDATARAVNEAGGTIRTDGAGARGLHVFVLRNTGPQVGVTENSGEIVTTGDVTAEGTRPSGIDSNSISGGTLAWNRTTGRVRTRGSGAYGVVAGSRGEGSTARAVNEGSIRTEGEEAKGLYAWSNPVASGRAEVVNRRSGRVETTGDTNAWGLMAWADGESSSVAVITNEGTVTTSGTNSEGVLAVAGNGGTSVRPNSAHAINTTGATIETQGDGSSGLNATVVVRGTGRVDSAGIARAENHGTVVAAGGILEEEVARGGTIVTGAPGVIAHYWPWTDETEIGNTGAATVMSTGDVTVTGGSAGLASRTFGTGTTTVEMTGGSVTSGARDDSATPVDESRFGIGIWAVARTDSTADDPSDDTDVRIAVSGSGTTVTAYGATTDDPATDDWDEGTGIGIFGKTGETGHIEVEVSGGATITADRAAVFEGGRTTFTLDASTLVGDVEFAGLDDHLTVRNGFIDGDVHFGDGTDTLVLNVPESGGITGRITGVEEVMKRGAGLAHIFDAKFTGSALEIEEGELSVTGHLDLGSDGTLTVHDPSRLAVVVGDLTEDAGGHGRITAGGGVIYQGLEEDEAPEMFLRLGSDVLDRAGAIQTVLEESPIDVLGDDTRVRRQTDAGPVDVDETRLSTADPDGSTRAIGSVQADGQVDLAAGVTLVAQAPTGDPTPWTEQGRSGSGRPNTGLMLAGGGALFAALIFDSLDDEETALADWDEATGERRTLTSFGGIRSGHALEHRVRTGGIEQWTRTFAGDAPIVSAGATGTARGVAMGLDARLGRGFRVGMAAMPDFSLSASAGPASAYDSRLDGRHFAIRGDWSGASLFASAVLSRGHYRAQSLFDNPVAGGVLSGESGLAHSRIQGRAGARLGLGPVRATPLLSLFSGSLRQAAHVALSASLRADVPAFSQRYDGWKAGLDLTPSGWLQGPWALRWRPGLHLASTRTRTHGPAAVNLRQSDRAGVLGFSSAAGVRALPSTVHSFGASLSAMQSDSWRFRLGYVGLVVDGEPVHAAVGRLHVRF